jgi:hypothetical protein
MRNNAIRNPLFTDTMSGENKEQCDHLKQQRGALIAVLLCVVICAGVCVVVLYKKLRRVSKYQRPDGIYLQIATERLTETIHVGESHMPLDQVFQKGQKQPILQDLTVRSEWGQNEIRVTWGRTLYAMESAAENQGIKLIMPDILRISGSLAKELQREYSQTKIVRLVRYVGGLASVVPNDVPMMTMAGWTVVGRGTWDREHLSVLNQNAMSRGNRGRRPPEGTSPRPKERKSPRPTGSGERATNLPTVMEMMSEGGKGQEYMEPSIYEECAITDV